MSETPGLPRRRWRLVLDLEADTPEDLITAIDNIGIRLCIDGVTTREISSGGVSSEWHMEMTENERQTPDGYAADLKAWMAARRLEAPR